MPETSWTTSADEQPQNWDASEGEVAKSYTYVSAPVAATWVEISGETSQQYIYDGTQVANQQFLTNFSWNPIWETNIDIWEQLQRMWGAN